MQIQYDLAGCLQQSGTSVTLSNHIVEAALGLKGTAAALQAMETTAAALSAYDTANQVGQIGDHPAKAVSIGINRIACQAPRAGI